MKNDKEIKVQAEWFEELLEYAAKAEKDKSLLSWLFGFISSAELILKNNGYKIKKEI